MFGWLRKLWGGGKRSRKASAGTPAAPRIIRARYDAAQTTDENRRHWANTDALSANAAHSAEVRKRLRERSRYEVSNNSYADGIIQTLANNLVGPGPRLQVQTGDMELNDKVQKAFAAWASATRLADQLRTMTRSKKVDGESFGVLTTNAALPTAVRLDLRLIEADQVASPDTSAYLRPDVVDGIRFDEDGNPIEYDVLHYHPGDALRGFNPGHYTLPARRVVHWFRCDRPGQARGVPELTPALPLFAQLRRFSLATLTAAETAAMFAAMLQTEAPGSEDDISEGNEFETLEIERGMMTTLPAGYTMAQLRAEHPSTTYEMFERLILRQIARCLHIPWNIAAGDSSSYNYSSARLDHLNYWSALAVERSDLEREVLEPLFMAWLAEAVLIPGMLPAGIRAFLTHLPHAWHWAPREHIDPTVEAAADTERLANGTATLAGLCAARGEDWQEVIRQRVRERQFEAAEAARVGVPSAPPVAARESVPLAIAAAATPASFRITGTAGVAIRAADAATNLRRFDMIAYTGGLMQLDGFDRPVVVDLAGLSVPDNRRPILRDHLAWKIVGHSEEIRNSLRDLAVAGVISGTGPHVAEVVSLSDNGFPWQASIGASADVVEFVEAGRTCEVNGQTFTGPLYVARKTTLREISFVANGADGNTQAAIAATGGNTAMTFEEFIVMLGFTLDKLDEQQIAALKMVFSKAYPEAVAPATPDQAASQQAGDTPAAAAAPAPAVAAGAARPVIQTTGTVDIAAQMRRTAVDEINRQNGIRRAIGSDAGREIELNENGQRRRVNLMAHAIEAGWNADRVELEVLREDRRTNMPFGYVVSGTPAMTAQTIEAAMCRTLKLPNLEKHFTAQTLEAADRQFKTIGLQQVLILAAAQNGYRAGPGQRITAGNLRSIMNHAFPSRIEAGWTALSLPGIFSNVANKEVLEGYMQEDGAWREVSATRSVSDFKQITSYRLLDSFEYEEVGPTGKIAHGKLDEESYTRQAKTYAKMLGLTRTDLINDDMGAFDALRSRLGRGSAMKLRSVFWTKWLATVGTHWTTARTNYIEGATTTLLTDGVGLSLAVKAFRTMRSPSADGSKRMGGDPVILLVPPELESAADVLYTARNVAAVKGSDANIHSNKYRPVVVPELSDSTITGYSTTAWWLLRSPGISPAAVVSFLDGVETPTIEDAEADFDTLGVQFRGYHDFGVDMAEYLAGVRSKGAA